MTITHMPEFHVEPTIETGGKNKTWVNVLAAIGFISLLAVFFFVSVQVVRALPTLSESLSAAVTSVTTRFFEASEETMLAITLESQRVQSDMPFEFSWNASQKESVDYTLTYECADALSVTLVTKEGERADMVCGDAYGFTTEANTVTLTPHSPDNRFLDASFKLEEYSWGEVVGSKIILLTIENERVEMSGTATAVKPTPSMEEIPAPTLTRPAPKPAPVTIAVPLISNPNGYTDLEVTILAVGTMDRSGNLTPTSNELEGDKQGGVRFVIKNIGTKTSPVYDFEVKLPTRPAFTYSPKQSDKRALMPGERIEYTLGFNRISSKDTGVISIVVDPDRDIEDVNRANNDVSVTVTIND
jgi:hypothetical protein